MNIFTFVSNTLGGASQVITKTLKAVENCAEIAEESTHAMVQEQRAESAKRLQDLEMKLVDVTPSKANQKETA